MMSLKWRAKVIDFPSKSHPPRIPTKKMLKEGIKNWDKVKHLPLEVNILQAWIAMHDYWYRTEQFNQRQQEIDEQTRREALFIVR